MPLNLVQWPIILNDRMRPNGRHLVLGDHDGPHRLWIKDIQPDQPLAYIIVRDASIDLRRGVAARLDRRLAGAPAGQLPPGLCPTPFQQHRMRLLLDILDMVDTCDPERPTTYDIARLLIYRHMTIRRGMEWKSSSERRRTQRLVDEALALMNGGYRSLLRGQMTVRQKDAAPFSHSP